MITSFFSDICRANLLELSAQFFFLISRHKHTHTHTHTHILWKPTSSKVTLNFLPQNSFQFLFYSTYSKIFTTNNTLHLEKHFHKLLCYLIFWVFTYVSYFLLVYCKVFFLLIIFILVFLWVLYLALFSTHCIQSKQYQILQILLGRPMISSFYF